MIRRSVWDQNLTQDAEALRLEDALQRREVDDEQLPHDGGQDSVAERPVAAQAHLMDHAGLRTQFILQNSRNRGSGSDTGFGSHLRARAQSVEHVEEDEAGEGHGGVSRSDHVVLQLKSKQHRNQIRLESQSEDRSSTTSKQEDGAPLSKRQTASRRQ